MVHTLTADAFDAEVTNRKGLVIVDFWAEWCGPCKALAPVFEKLSERYPNVYFAKANVDEENRLASRFAVTSIPTVFFFKEGNVVQQIMGFASESKFAEAIDALLN